MHATVRVAARQVRFGRCSGKLSACGGDCSIFSIRRLTVPDTVCGSATRGAGVDSRSLAQSKSPPLLPTALWFQSCLSPASLSSPRPISHPLVHPAGQNARAYGHGHEVTAIRSASGCSDRGPPCWAPRLSSNALAMSTSSRIQQDSDSGCPIRRATRWPPNGQSRCTLPSESAPSQMRLACTLDH